MEDLITCMNTYSGAMQVILTLGYVVVTVLILFSNRQSIKAMENSTKQSLYMHDQSIKVQLFDRRKEFYEKFEEVVRTNLDLIESDKFSEDEKKQIEKLCGEMIFLFDEEIMSIANEINDQLSKIDRFQCYVKRAEEKEDDENEDKYEALIDKELLEMSKNMKRARKRIREYLIIT